MSRSRKPEYKAPIEHVSHQSIERKLISASPVWTMAPDDLAALIDALKPPGDEYPMLYIPKPGDENPNAYRDWLIGMLGILTDCYPHPINMGLDCLRKSLIEVNRGLTPNLFKSHKPARGGKVNFSAQEAMNLAVLAANYVHDETGNDDSYEQSLFDAGTNRREIDQWKGGRIDPAYKCSAIVAWHDLPSAIDVLRGAIADYRKHSGRTSRRARNLSNPASKRLTCA